MSDRGERRHSVGQPKPLRVGKLSSEELNRYILSYLGPSDRRVIFGPQIGGDSAALRFRDGILVLTIDPILGASKNLGELAVNVCLNDLLCLGAKPQALLTTLLLPEGFTGQELKALVRDLNRAAQSQGVSIVGGHTEVVLGFSRSPIVITTGIGRVRPRGLLLPRARPGDKVLLTKSAGLEGTAILASEFPELESHLPKTVLRRAKGFIREISVRPEAEIGARLKVSAMHDPTDRGVLGGLEELAQASSVGLRIEQARVPVAKETQMICDHFEIDPLQLISSGSLLLTCRPQKLNRLFDSLRDRGIPVALIGEVTDRHGGCLLRQPDGKEVPLQAPKLDPLWQLLLRSRPKKS